MPRRAGTSPPSTAASPKHGPRIACGIDSDQEGAPCAPAVGYLVFDLETTGLGDRCRIVEFAGIVLDSGLRTGKCYETLVNPGGTPGPTWLHGLDREMLCLAPSFEDVASDIERLFRDRVVVAHNLKFDWSVLRRSFGALGVEVPVTNGGVCTATVARRALPGPSGLGQVCRHLGVGCPAPHRAGPDASATVEVLRALQAKVPTLTTGRPCPVFSGAWRLHASLPALRRADAASRLGRS